MIYSKKSPFNTIFLSRFFVIVTLAFLVTVTSVMAQKQATKFIAANDKSISYMGRIEQTDSCANINWTGSSITMRVKNASSLKAMLADDNGNNYYYVIIDENSAKIKKIKVAKEKQLYTLVSNLTAAVHTITLFKITNTDFITTHFYGFETDAKATIIAPLKKPERKIEFFGNSITCGHGVEIKPDSTDSGEPQYFNNYLAYGAITARHFNAQYYCTAKSGIGITISWFPEVMQDIYDRLNPANPASKWDFKLYQPDIVVVNLFQNDSWLVNMPEHPQFKARFGTTKPTEIFIKQAYKKLIGDIRDKYPNANIICCLGNMDATRTGSAWPGYIEGVVSSLNDKKIVTHNFTYKNTSGHPKIKEQQAMANDLVAFIKARGYWK